MKITGYNASGQAIWTEEVLAIVPLKVRNEGQEWVTVHLESGCQVTERPEDLDRRNPEWRNYLKPKGGKVISLNKPKAGQLLFLEVTKVNATRGVRFYDSGVFESRCETPGEAYREFLGYSAGRCTGKVYIDHPETGEARQVGWVFQKRERYSDARRPYTENDYYLEETWVVVHTKKRTVVDRELPLIFEYLADLGGH